jgi:hypothetical protein
LFALGAAIGLHRSPRVGHSMSTPAAVMKNRRIPFQPTAALVLGHGPLPLGVLSRRPRRRQLRRNSMAIGNRHPDNAFVASRLRVRHRIATLNCKNQVVLLC